MAKQPKPCSVCRGTDEKHCRTQHSFQVVSDPGDPLALTICVPRNCFFPASKARHMARVRQEMKQYFPDRTFEIQPSRMMLTKDDDQFLLGQAHVTGYIAFEV